MNLFINAVKRAEEDARECEAAGFNDAKANWVNHLPAFLMKAELIAFVKDSARAACYQAHPELFNNYTPLK